MLVKAPTGVPAQFDLLEFVQKTSAETTGWYERRVKGRFWMWEQQKEGGEKGQQEGDAGGTPGSRSSMS